MYEWKDNKPEQPPRAKKRKPRCDKPLKNGGWCGKNKGHWFGCGL